MRSAHFDAAEARPIGLRAAVTSCVGACCGVPGVCGVGTARRFGREAIPWMLLRSDLALGDVEKLPPR